MSTRHDSLRLPFIALLPAIVLSIRRPHLPPLLLLPSRHCLLFTRRALPSFLPRLYSQLLYPLLRLYTPTAILGILIGLIDLIDLAQRRRCLVFINSMSYTTHRLYYNVYILSKPLYNSLDSYIYPLLYRDKTEVIILILYS